MIDGPRDDPGRVRQLLRATARLSSAIDEAEVAAIMLGEGTAALGAATGALWRADEHELILVGAHGYTPGQVAMVRRLPRSPETPIADAVARGTPIFIGSLAEFRARYPRSAARVEAERGPGEVAFAAVPLVVEQARLGVLAFAFHRARELGEDDRVFLELLAQHCAQGLARADLYEAERAAREHAEQARRIAEDARERAAFLARAGGLLSQSLEVESTLRAVAALAVPRIADWCGIEVGTAEASEQVAVAHVDPAKVSYARELRRRYPPDRTQPRGVPQVIRTGASELYPAITDEMLVASARDPEHLRIARALGLRSALIVPIRAGERVLGAIGFYAAESDRRYGPDDVAMAEELGQRAGLAIANAQLYEAERRARARIDQLQRATAAFAAARSLAEIAAVTLQLATDVVGAAQVMLWQLDPEADALVLLDARGLDPTARADLDRVPLSSPWPVARAGRTGEAHFLGDAELRALAYPTPLQAGAAIPLVVQDRRVGVIGIGFTHARGFSPDDQELLRAIAHQCAQAIDRVHAYEEVVRAVAARDDFLSIAGHELKTPLTAMHLGLEGIVKLAHAPAPSQPRLVERATRVFAQAQRLARLVDELLDVSRVSRGRLVLELDEVDLGELVAGCAGRLEDEARKAGCELRVSAPAGVRGWWDRGRIEQVVTNLLSNALKYGGGHPVELVVEARAASVAVSVRDHGIGIEPAAQQRIFERFERAVSSRHYGGLGLGLWIARQIVEAHGGRIAVWSVPGQGARFEVTLPRGDGHSA